MMIENASGDMATKAEFFDYFKYRLVRGDSAEKVLG